MRNREGSGTGPAVTVLVLAVPAVGLATLAWLLSVPFGRGEAAIAAATYATVGLLFGLAALALARWGVGSRAIRGLTAATIVWGIAVVAGNNAVKLGIPAWRAFVAGAVIAAGIAALASRSRRGDGAKD